MDDTDQPTTTGPDPTPPARRAFSSWFETTWRTPGEAKELAVMRLCLEAQKLGERMGQTPVWRALRGLRVNGNTLRALVAIAGPEAFDGVALVTAPQSAPRKPRSKAAA